MKLVILIALFALAFAPIRGAESGDPKASTPTASKPSERALTEVEVLKTELASEKMKDLQSEYKISEYQKKSAEPQKMYSDVVMEACLSVGVELSKIQTECGFTNGLGPDGEPLKTPDGKPVPARVWRIAPAAKK